VSRLDIQEQFEFVCITNESIMDGLLAHRPVPWSSGDPGIVETGSWSFGLRAVVFMGETILHSSPWSQI
jgi:hypothetical protein